MSHTAAAAPHQGDNLLGVCHAMGEAVGINPLFIRLALALCFLLKFELALAIYAACAMAVYFEKVVAWALRARRPVAKAG